MTRLKIRLLGPVGVEVGDQGIPVGRPKVRVVLANLALHVGRTVSTDVLSEALWNGNAPDDPRHALQMHMCRLRAVHPQLDASVKTEPDGYRLAVEPHDVDAVRFERIAHAAHGCVRRNPRRAATAIESALSMWRGQAFGDLYYDEFATGAVRRLEELRVRAMEDRCEVAILLDEAEAVICDLEQLVSDHPMRDRPIELLLRALVAAGRPTAARYAYRRYTMLLRDEFGLDPSPTLTRLAGEYQLIA